MVRLLLIGALLGLGACGAVPSGGELLEPPVTARSGDGWMPSFDPSRLPLPRRGRAPSDERPAWLPNVPRNMERYPVPDSWRRDGLAMLTPAEASAPF